MVNIFITEYLFQVKLSREEGHVDALEQQLNNLDNNREQLERKLHTVYTSLRTVTRMYHEGPPASPSFKGSKKSKLGKIKFKIKTILYILNLKKKIVSINLSFLFS